MTRLNKSCLDKQTFSFGNLTDDRFFDAPPTVFFFLLFPSLVFVFCFSLVLVCFVVDNSYTFDTENMGRIMRKRTDDAGQRLGGQVKQHLRQIFENRYRAGKNLWFFSKLRF